MREVFEHRTKEFEEVASDVMHLLFSEQTNLSFCAFLDLGQTLVQFVL